MIVAFCSTAIIRRAMKILLCLLVCAVTIVDSRAAVIDIPALKDTTLYESATGHLANGGGSFFFAGRTGQQSEFRRRGLIAFDVAAFVPAGAVINSAQLILN